MVMLMNLYNPFKPHIVCISGKFYIRKFTLEWAYLSKAPDSTYWWGSADSDSSFPTADLAAAKLLKYPALVKAKKEAKKVKVLNTKHTLNQYKVKKVFDVTDEE